MEQEKRTGENQMFTEEELKKLLKQKEKERRELEYKKADRIDKLRLDLMLTIEINLIKHILRKG